MPSNPDLLKRAYLTLEQAALTRGLLSPREKELLDELRPLFPKKPVAAKLAGAPIRAKAEYEWPGLPIEEKEDEGVL